MRIGHASISENGNSGRDGKAKAGDQTGKEVCIRNFYKKPWVYLLRVKDRNLAEKMAKCCETLCNNNHIGYDQLNRLTLYKELKKINYDYNKLNVDCETDCSAFVTVICQCCGINIPYPSGNAPTTSNMVRIFEATGYFDVITDSAYINTEANLRKGDILVGKPATHTVMVLDDGSTVAPDLKPSKTNEELAAEVIAGKWGSGNDRRQRLEKAGYNYKEIQNLVNLILKG